MKKVKRILNINDCIKKLDFILYNFYVTDLVMHKQEVMYESESYKRKTYKRLQRLFKKVKKILKKQDKEMILKVLTQQEEEYLKQLKIKIEEAKKNNIQRIYIPEEDILVEIRVTGFMFWRDIKSMLEKEENAEKTVEDVFKLHYHVMKKSMEDGRKELQNYGYIIKKEKYLKKLQ